MNNFSPDQLYDSIQARHQDILKAETARQAAKLAQGEQPNWSKGLFNTVINLVQNTSSRLATKANTQLRLRNKQA